MPEAFVADKLVPFTLNTTPSTPTPLQTLLIFNPYFPVIGGLYAYTTIFCCSLSNVTFILAVIPDFTVSTLVIST